MISLYPSCIHKSNVNPINRGIFTSLHPKADKNENLERLKFKYFIDIQWDKLNYSCRNFSANNKNRDKMNWQALIVVYKYQVYLFNQKKEYETFL